MKNDDSLDIIIVKTQILYATDDLVSSIGVMNEVAGIVSLWLRDIKGGQTKKLLNTSKIF